MMRRKRPVARLRELLRSARTKSALDGPPEPPAVSAELDAIFYAISHDLRAPLRTIHGFGEALGDEASQLSADGREYLERIVSAAARMEELFADLQKLAQVSRMELRLQDVNISEVADSIARSLRTSEPARPVAFQVERDIIVRGDPALLRTALEQLIANAWKFTRPRVSATIAIRADRRNGRITIHVEDDGVGFDMAYAQRLFAPFQRLHGAAEFEGNGIGLAIVQRIIHKHGGTIRATASRDRGTTVSFELE
jgi:light-regulated signal transduction histidine kinase (bacteriophytochrome)